jgi:predicted RNase H-like nuclease (RuvC/YqgF family)
MGELNASLRDLEAKNKELNEALKLATTAAENSLQSNCINCDSTQQKLDDLKTKLQDQVKTEMKLRGELAQNKQLMTITQANEKLLEEHVSSLEAQINALVNDYETKLGDV